MADAPEIRLPPPTALEILRAAAFNLVFWVWTAVMALALVPIVPFMREPETVRIVPRSWMRSVRVLLRWIVGLGCEWRGLGNLPGEPVILACRHQSAWETLAFMPEIPNVAIALKSELQAIPIFGWYTRRARMIRIERAHGASALRALIADANAAMEAGDNILIFPEGTRTPPGAHAPYHPGVAALYTRLGRPVVPVALNSGLFWGRRAFVKRPGTVIAELLEPIPPGLDRKAFMEVLRARLEPATDRLVEEGLAELGVRP